MKATIEKIVEEVVTLTMSREEATLLYRLFYYHVQGNSPLSGSLAALTGLKLDPRENGNRAPVPGIYGTSEVDE